MFAAEVTMTGPLLGGPVEAHVERLVDMLTWAVGAQALADWHRLLDRHIQVPTPYYETQLVLQRDAAGVVAHDRGVIYGPWLEGTSRRNARTAFKGYHAARLATAAAAAQVEQVTAPVVSSWIGEVS